MSLLSVRGRTPRMDSPAGDEKRRVPVGRNTRALFSFVPEAIKSESTTWPLRLNEGFQQDK